MDNTNNVMYKGSHKIRSGSRPLPVVKVITMVLLQSPEQEFMVELTDEKDPFFYYTLKLSQEDFLLIKDQQNLTSEFNQFPDQLISLLKKTQQTETSLYIHIDINEQNILLYIREEGTIKHMTHLTLQFKKKPSQEIQDHVIESIKRLTAINETEEDYKSRIKALQTRNQQEKKKSHRAKSHLELHINTLNKDKFILKGRLIKTSNKYESCRNKLQKLQKETKTLQVRVEDYQENSCKIQLKKKYEMLRRQAKKMNNALKDEINKREDMEEKLEDKTSEILQMRALETQNEELREKLESYEERSERQDKEIDRLNNELIQNYKDFRNKLAVQRQNIGLNTSTGKITETQEWDTMTYCEIRKRARLVKYKAERAAMIDLRRKLRLMKKTHTQ